MRSPLRRAPHRPPPLIAPAGCPPAAAASGACQSAARWPRLVGSQLSGGCAAAHLEREGRGRGGARGEGALGADFRSRENRPGPPGTPDPGLRTQAGRGPESRPPAEGDPCREGQEGGQPARTGGSEGPRLAVASPGFPGAGRAPAPLLARRHRERRLGLAAHGGDARRGWFLGEPRALPTELQQEAKSKSQSLRLHAERHPISWERARCAE